MSDQSSDQPGFDPNNPPSEEELAAAYEAQLKQLRVEDVVLQTVVSLLNLGGRKAGLAPGPAAAREAAQVGLAGEGARALLPLVEDKLGPDAATLREALSQLQLAFVRLGGTGEAPQGAPGTGEPQPEDTGPPKSSGRLWVPGQ